MPEVKNGVNSFVAPRSLGVRFFLKGRKSHMKKLMYTLMVGAVSLGMTAGTVRAQERAKDELETRAQTVNQLADRHGGIKDAIRDVSVETGVPEGQLQKMHDSHPDAGAAGLLIACVMADNTKGSPEKYLTQHVNGRGWASIARDNNVPLDKINVKLDNLQHELGGMPATGRDKGRNNY